MSLLAYVYLEYCGALNNGSDEFKDRYSVDARLDELIFDRIRIALRLERIATAFSSSPSASATKGVWQSLAKLARDTYAGKTEDHLQFAITNRFKKDESRPFTQLHLDYGDKKGHSRIDGLEPYTYSDLIALYLDRQNRSLVRHLGEMTEKQKRRHQESTATPKHLFTTARAQSAMEKERIPIPTRYKADKAAFIAGSVENRSLFPTLLTRHHRYLQLENTESKRRRRILFPKSWMIHKPGLPKPLTGEVVVWSLPHPHELIAPLRQIPLLNGMVYLLHTDQIHSLRATTQTDPVDGTTHTVLYSTPQFIEEALEHGSKDTGPE